VKIAKPPVPYTIFCENCVEQTVRFSPEGGIVFRFYIASGGALRADFRPLPDSTLDLELILEAESEAIVRVLYHGRKRSIFNCRTIQDHIGNGSQSTVIVKCVCENHARVNYRGEIVVPEAIAGVNVTQLNKNLVLSRNACVHTEPTMDIRSKDVNCLHGAAIGEMDREILQYFALRGIKKGNARRLSVAGFLQ
jgi:Fe-S cluster assembly scaffold protein SufB